MKDKIKKILFILMFVIGIGNISAVTQVDCGNVTDIPSKIPEITSMIVTIIEILVPVILVVMGSIDLFKGITSQKEDELKKSQQIFIKRLIVGAIIFFVIVIVKFAVSLLVDATEGNNISECIDCFLSNRCKNEHQRIIRDSDNYGVTTNQSSKTNNVQQKSNNSKVKKHDSSNSKSSTESSSTSKSSSSSNQKKYLFVGDSRTVGMCDTYKLCENNEYIAESGQGYNWFINTAISSINNKISSNNYNIIILIGVNDVGTNGTSVASQYYDKIYGLATTTWKEQNIVFVSVNPVVDEKSNAYMSGVNSFNAEIKSKISSSKLSNLKYCDTASSLDISLIDSGDGLHYNKDGYSQIYNIIKQNC